ncbi:hypothetical protein PIB30_014119 [Stylosanthes scabra]|uniref:Uncharacterized protein n=1 Tax=Stylosanthes scabra TaxID=79078 RepID=A0ABU6T697_9FABA|nr:hypothetical protein [Stylosanthes scabra]
MSRPLYRSVSGVRTPEHNHDSWESLNKDKVDKEDFDKKGSSNHSSLSGHHRLQMPETKIIKKDGRLYIIIQKIFAGKCFHSKMKLLCGKKKPVKEIATAQERMVLPLLYVVSSCLEWWVL